MSSFRKLWRARLGECLSPLSPSTKHWPKVSAEHFLNMEKVPKSKSISFCGEMLQECLCEQTALCPRCSGTGVPGSPRAFGVCLCEQKLLAAMHRLKLCWGTQILSSFPLAFTWQKLLLSPHISMDSILLLWGYFALNLGCVCLFHSKNKDLFPFPSPSLSQKSSGVSSLYLKHPLFPERKETAPSINELRI